MAREQPVRPDTPRTRRQKPVVDRIRERELWQPPVYDPEARKLGARVCFDKDDMRAVHALSQGTASKTDQVRAFNWIVNVACLWDEDTFNPGRGHVAEVSAFLQGKRSAGSAIRKLVNLKPEIYPDE